ncbi:MAG: phospholipase, partial [Candidatus Marinimicrobia bacterium]|nr:phospholipase [Candidatus Neomarinimicrobiota bacterium]
MKRMLILLLTVCGAFALDASPEALALFEARTYVSAAGDTLLYRLLRPQDPKPGKDYPLVLFLHGSGERGRDNERQLIWGAGAFINEKNMKKYPCYVVAPQCPEDKRWLEVHWALDA